MIDISRFFQAARAPNQTQIDWLTKTHAVPVKALGCDPGHDGFCIGRANMIFSNGFFDFEGEAEGPVEPALLFIARNECGDPFDFVAWSPKSGKIASYDQRAALLGQHEVFAPRFDGPLQIHPTPLEWLRAGRWGVVIVDPVRAAPLLREAAPLLASSVEHGQRLRQLLAVKPPCILVPKQRAIAA